MSKIKMDLLTAEWIVDKAENDVSAFPMELDECEECGAVYIPALGHDCDTVVDIEFHAAERREE